MFDSLSFLSKSKALKTSATKVSANNNEVLLVMNLIPGDNFYPDNESELFQQQNNRNEKKKVLLYFLGGVTFAEIGAIRFMNQQKDAKFRFVIATTQIISGNRAVSQMRSCVANNLDPLSITSK